MSFYVKRHAKKTKAPNSMFLPVLGLGRDILWAAPKVAEAPMYVVSGACRALWEGAKVLVLCCLSVVLPGSCVTEASIVSVHTDLSSHVAKLPITFVA